MLFCDNMACLTNILILLVFFVQTCFNSTVFNYKWDKNWPNLNEKVLGAVSAVTIDNDQNVLIFHRGKHIWNAQTFNLSNYYQFEELGPITENTVLKLDRNSGKIIEEWGDNMFYIPHGLTIDKNNNAWITDVALHQVFKFNLEKSRVVPELELGTRFQPGNDDKRFCKPTSVAVLDNGDFFVADGYCNSRIIKYSAKGERILSWGKSSFQARMHGAIPNSYFAVPHALTLANEKEWLCVADRENGRIECFKQTDGTFIAEYKSPVMGERLFSLAYCPINGGLLYIVNGPQLVNNHEIKGYIVEINSTNIIGSFAPNNTNNMFSNPHDIAVTSDGSEIYVAELNPTVIHKLYMTSLKPTVTVPTTSSIKSPISYISPVESNEQAHQQHDMEVEVEESQMWIFVLTSTTLILIAAITIKLVYKKVTAKSMEMQAFLSAGRDEEDIVT